MRTNLILIAMLIIAGCSSPEKAHAPELLGTWENTFLLVESADAGMMDPMYQMMVADTTNWDRVMGMKPSGRHLRMEVDSKPSTGICRTASIRSHGATGIRSVTLCTSSSGNLTRSKQPGSIRWPWTHCI